jgi:natural product precursor
MKKLKELNSEYKNIDSSNVLSSEEMNTVFGGKCNDSCNPGCKNGCTPGCKAGHKEGASVFEMSQPEAIAIIE